MFDIINEIKLDIFHDFVEKNKDLLVPTKENIEKLTKIIEENMHTFLGDYISEMIIKNTNKISNNIRFTSVVYSVVLEIIFSYESDTQSKVKTETRLESLIIVLFESAKKITMQDALLNDMKSALDYMCKDRKNEMRNQSMEVENE